ncbi:MAG TPA: hypothetical protein VLD37_07295 [Candidatus Bilamarchaeum sp.]|nr:hypothetical protein [Candidatus Bilamarchaeum sp.]
MEEKTFNVVISGYSPAAERIRARMRKYFRRRAASVTPGENGSLDVRLRNGTTVKYSEVSAKQFRREPFVEMTVTTTESYLEKSMHAMHAYAKRCDFSLFVDAREKPKK